MSQNPVDPHIQTMLDEAVERGRSAMVGFLFPEGPQSSMPPDEKRMRFGLLLNSVVILAHFFFRSGGLSNEEILAAIKNYMDHLEDVRKKGLN
jgi:hypothetical protein